MDRGATRETFGLGIVQGNEGVGRCEQQEGVFKAVEVGVSDGDVLVFRVGESVQGAHVLAYYGP